MVQRSRFFGQHGARLRKFVAMSRSFSRRLLATEMRVLPDSNLRLIAFAVSAYRRDPVLPFLAAQGQPSFAEHRSARIDSNPNKPHFHRS